MGEIEFIADYYGISHQLKKLIEEMSEVTKEIIKLDLSQNDKEIEDIFLNRLPDELADLSVVYDQVVYLLGCKEKVARNRKYKVLRQLGRMAEESLRMSKRNKCYLRSKQEIVSDMHRSYEEIIKNPSKVSQIFKRKPYDLRKEQSNAERN